MPPFWIDCPTAFYILQVLSTQGEKNFLSQSGDVNNVLLILFTFFAKGAIYYVAIATVIFSHVKIQSCILFLGKSSPSISLVVI